MKSTVLLFMEGVSYLLNKLSNWAQIIKFIFFYAIIILLIFSLKGLPYAESAKQSSVKISYKNGSLQITANNVDLELVLSELSKATNISVVYLRKLKKIVSINKNNTTIDNALARILKGVNHSIIYSGDNADQVEIEKIFVLPEKKKLKISSHKTTRLKNRIRSYQRQISNLEKYLSKLDKNSPRAKVYGRRIKKFRTKIEQIERQLY